MPVVSGLVRQVPQAPMAEDSRQLITLDRSGAQYVSDVNSMLGSAGLGMIFTANTPTFGTGVAISSAARTTFLATEAALLIRNTAGAATGKNVYPLWAQLICTAAGTGPTSIDFGVVVTPANRYGSGGTALTLVSPHSGNADTPVASIHYGNIALTAGSGSDRQLARTRIKTGTAPTLVVGDVLTLTFGADDMAMGLLSGAGAAQYVSRLPPVCLGGGGNHSMALHYWAAGQSAAPSFEATVCWAER